MCSAGAGTRVHTVRRAAHLIESLVVRLPVLSRLAMGGIGRRQSVSEHPRALQAHGVKDALPELVSPPNAAGKIDSARVPLLRTNEPPPPLIYSRWQWQKVDIRYP